MRLEVKLYLPKWMEEIHEEWIRKILEERPALTRDQLKRTRELVNRHGGACFVTGYEPLIPSPTLPDENDHHILAAAIAVVPVIVTFNLKDFPNRTLTGHGVRAVHLERFVGLVKIHRQSLLGRKPYHRT